MNKLIKLLILTFTIFISSSIYAQECDISKNDISLIIGGIQNNTLPFVPEGFYVSLRDESYHTIKGSEYSNYIKKEGVKNVMFETDEQYQVFVNYLEAVKNKPCKYLKNDENNSYEKVKMVFSNKYNKYTLYMYQSDDAYVNISLNITGGRTADGSYDERAYIYSFKKENKKIYFKKINPAG